jgi:hypothetical protein
VRLRLFVALVLFGLLALGVDQLVPRGQGFGPALNTNRNGIWVDVDWVSDKKSDAAIAALCHDLAAKGFRYVYVYVNSVTPSGEGSVVTYRYAADFVRVARAAEPSLQLLGWVGVVNAARGQGWVEIEDSTVRRNIAEFARELTHEVGFDGVQLNVEPLANDSEAYLDLLAEVREAIGPEKVLGVAGHKWAPRFIPSPDRYSSYWHSDYYARIGLLVDQVALMTYDSYAPHPLLYRLFVREQALGATRALRGSNTDVLIGLPTYEEPRPNHNPEVENIETGLMGFLDAMARLGVSDRETLAGVAIYAHWVTDESEWRAYRRLWLGEASAAQP